MQDTATRVAHARSAARTGRPTVLALFLLGGAVLALLAWCYTGVRKQNDVMLRGESLDALAAVVDGLRLGAMPDPSLLADPGRPDVREAYRAGLERLIAADTRLRYAAVVIDQTPVASVGTPVATLPPLRGAPGLVQCSQDGRFCGMRRPLPFGRRKGHAQAGPPAPRFAWEPEVGPALLLELEPRVVRLLDRQATLLLVSAAALLLLSGVFAVWLGRVLTQRASLATELERKRHLGALGEMSAVLAHEIRNPLAALKGHGQLLQQMLRPESPEHAKADVVVAEAIRLERLTQELLAFARSGQIAPAWVDPVALLQESAHEVLPERIRIVGEGAPPRWKLDAGRIRQVLANLLRNAVEASPAEALVEATVSERGGHLVFDVQDHGCGIAPEILPHVFEPFFTRKLHGTGLGLALAQRIVQLHGGSLSAQSEVGRGSRFTLTLPKGES